MKRRSSLQVAVGTAFSRSAKAPTQRVDGGARPVRIRRSWLAFTAGFPGLIGVAALAAAFSRSGTTDGAFPLAIGSLAAATILLVLGARSALWVTREGLTVRFFGLRRSAIRFDELSTATFGMYFPSISFGLKLTERGGRRVVVHANWWDDEPAVVEPVCSALLAHDVAMDRTTARVVALTLGVKRPKPRIVHHGLLNKDRTW